MGDLVDHNCAVVAFRTLHDTYDGLKSLQHRGPECFGIVAVGNNIIDTMKGIGTVSDFKLSRLEQIFPADKYHTFIGHSRYATKGKLSILEGAHPHTMGGTVHNFRTHVIHRNVDAALVHNGQIEFEYLPVDLDKVKSGTDSEAALHYLVNGGINEIGFLKNVPGSYTLVFAEKTRKEVMILRDQCGIKPGVLGVKDGKYVMASEDVTLTSSGAKYREDILPGSVTYLNPDGSWFSKNPLVRKNLAHCFFEWNYIASPLSALEGVLVRTIRMGLGRQLAMEHPINDIDIVSYLPDSPEFAAVAYARELGIDFKEILSKENTNRSFLERNNEARKVAIEKNLHVLDQVKDYIVGKKILLIDDSTIRGNNSKRALEILKEAGVKEVVLRNYTPIIGAIGEDGVKRGCLYGVDMSPTDDFVARKTIFRNRKPVEVNRTLEEISSEIGMDVGFLSIKGMLKVFNKYGLDANSLCTFCIGGPKPF